MAGISSLRGAAPYEGDPKKSRPRGGGRLRFRLGQVYARLFGRAAPQRNGHSHIQLAPKRVTFTQVIVTGGTPFVKRTGPLMSRCFRIGSLTGGSGQEKSGN